MSPDQWAAATGEGSRWSGQLKYIISLKELPFVSWKNKVLRKAALSPGTFEDIMTAYLSLVSSVYAPNTILIYKLKYHEKN